jgi:PKHD-type hydroxylase
MATVIPQVLAGEPLQRARALLADAPWSDGRVTAGDQSAQVKNNQQLPQDHPVTAELRQIVLEALSRSLQFFSAALPKRVFPPLFNHYGGRANAFGDHIDSAVRTVTFGDAIGQQVRSDLSATLFLTDPADYDGGELVIVEEGFDARRVKLPAGHLLLYPASSVHRVEPVTRGVRMASFFWLQSMVRSDEQRRLLHAMDLQLLKLRQQLGDTDSPASREHLDELRLRLTDQLLSVEFRHPSWFDAHHATSTFDFEKERALVNVVLDEPQGRIDAMAAQWEVTNPLLAVVRLRGRTAASRPFDAGSSVDGRRDAAPDRGDYTEADLAELAEQIRPLSERVLTTHVVFDHPPRDRGQRNALRLMELLGAGR